MLRERNPAEARPATFRYNRSQAGSFLIQGSRLFFRPAPGARPVRWTVPYREILIGPQADAGVREFVAARVDLYLRDVHAMLRLPLPAVGVEAGCNFAIAEMLCAVIAGLSRIFVPTEKGAGAAFKAVLAAYPLQHEPAGVHPLAEIPEQLYTIYRCNVVHSLGMNIHWCGRSKRHEIQPLGTTKIQRMHASMSEAQLLELEGDSRPVWLGPTMELNGRTRLLNVEALYWGVRRLTQALATTAPFAADARTMLAPPQAVTGLSLGGVPGPRYTPPTHEISATATTVTSSAPWTSSDRE